MGRDFSGWTVRCGFLTGNLGDVDAGRYESELTAKLAEMFPGADIETPSRHAEGCLPNPLRPAAWDAEGDVQTDDVYDSIMAAAEGAFEACLAESDAGAPE